MDWIAIPGGEVTLGLTDEEAQRLAGIIAAQARANHEPDPLHGLRDEWMLEHEWANVEHLTEQLAFCRPAHRVTVAAYEISTTPVTVAQYQRFARATGADPPETTATAETAATWTEAMPVTGISWEEAAAYADWRGGALPTEAQWERAARGPDRRLFPWGNDWGTPGARLVAEVEKVRVGSRPALASPEGVQDLVTFLHEWCADEFHPYPGADLGACRRIMPPPAGWSGTRVRRGGQPLNLLPSALNRQGAHPDVPLNDTTFRLVRNIQRLAPKTGSAAALCCHSRRSNTMLSRQVYGKATVDIAGRTLACDVSLHWMWTRVCTRV